MRAIESIVNLMLETDLLRVCSFCEQEFGKVALKPGQTKTNGYCRRHCLLVADELPECPEKTEYIADMQSKPDGFFCPDMGAA